MVIGGARLTARVRVNGPPRIGIATSPLLQNEADTRMGWAPLDSWVRISGSLVQQQKKRLLTSIVQAHSRVDNINI